MFEWIASHFLVVSGFLLAGLAIAKILSERRSPQSLSAWLLLIIFIPWLGVPLFLMFGGRKMQALMDSKGAVVLSQSPPGGCVDSPVEHALCSLGIPPAFGGNSIHLEFQGATAFNDLLQLLNSAQQNIDYATFIFTDDEVAGAILDRLVDRARAGCRVRLLLDDVGCLKTPGRFFDPLLEAGGQVARFMPVLHLPFRGRTNLRNHRKMTIVDHRAVWTGGRNTAANYMGPAAHHGVWNDLSLSIEGPAVRAFSEVFESDWSFATGDPLPTSIPWHNNRSGSQCLQVVPSGPDVRQDALLGAILTAIYRAERNIRIVTPYFVPPEAVTEALSLAACRGVDVELILPKVSNHRLADWARGPHLDEVQEDGVKVRLYPGMIHAKALMFDDNLALVGSANVDERSLLLNYELMSAIYGGDQLRRLKTWADELSGQSEERNPTIGKLRRIGEGLAEIISPLL
jgi:cardiolipin synthase